MIPKLTEPWALLLLAFMPLLYLWCRRSLSGLSRVRQMMALIIRSAIMLLLILALARLELSGKSRDVCVLFVLDQSRSIPIRKKAEAIEYINNAVSSRERGKDDLAGLIVFAANGGIETSPSSFRRVSDIYSVLQPDGTDIASALRLAMAAFPEHTARRIVLISDGNQTRGDALLEAQNARSNGTVIDVYPLELLRGAEVLVDKVILPPQVLPEEEFEIKVVVKSFQHTKGTLRLFRDDQLVATKGVDLLPDRPNVFTMALSLAEPDFYQFEAVIEPEEDTLGENNRGYGFVDVKGEPKILVVTGDSKGDDYLARALVEEGLHVSFGGTSDIPISPEQMQKWDLLVLSNVPASAMTGGKNSQMALIRDSVRNSGIGLIMVGGDNSFGAGGYKGTEIEEALPVEMDVTHKKILPSGALVLVMDAVEFTNGNAWAREICRAALDGISTRDKLGIYTNGWFLPLAQASDKGAIRRQIRQMQAVDNAPDRGLQSAHVALAKTSAGIKHVVVISDSGCNSDISSLLDSMVNDRITVSAVVIGPHTPQMANNMAWIARRGMGNFYYPKTPNSLPQIFFREAAVVKKALIWDKEPFRPVLKYTTPPLSGIGGGQLPPLLGYVVTTVKKSPLVDLPIISHNNDPIFAHWRYGLGKTVAFTADVKNRWGAHWVSWPQFSRFWAQTVRWCLRPTTGWDYNVQTRIDGSQGRIVVDAVNEKGVFENFLEITGTVSTPDVQTQPVALSQTGPGRYEGTFRADAVGTYIVTLADAKKKQPAPFRSGVSISYSPEYRQFDTNHVLLKQLAEMTGGRLLEPSDNVFDHSLAPIGVSRPLWSGLLLAAICLFPFDVFIRRVLIDYEKLAALVSALLSRLPVVGILFHARPKAGRDVMQRLLKRKREVQAGPSSGPDMPPPDLGTLNVQPDVERGPSVPGREEKSKAEKMPPEETKEPSTYTQRLLDAKKRARERNIRKE